MTKILTNAEYKRLIDIAHNYELRAGGSASFESGMPISGYQFSLPSDLTGISGSTPGKVENCHAFKLDVGSGNLVDLNWTATIYNATTSTIQSGTYVTVSRDPLSGQFFVSGSGGGNAVVEGRLAGGLASFGTATLNVYTGTGGAWANSGSTVTVKDRAGWTGSTGSYCMAEYINGEWRPIVVDCN